MYNEYMEELLGFLEYFVDMKVDVVMCGDLGVIMFLSEMV